MGSSASHLWLTPGSYVSFPLPPNSLFLNPCHVLFWNPSRTLVHGRWQCCRNSTYMTQSVPQVDYKSCTVLGLSFLNGTQGHKIGCWGYVWFLHMSVLCKQQRPTETKHSRMLRCRNHWRVLGFSTATLLPVLPWASYLTSLNFDFPTWEMGVVPYRVVIRPAQHNNESHVWLRSWYSFDVEDSSWIWKFLNSPTSRVLTQAEMPDPLTFSNN